MQAPSLRLGPVTALAFLLIVLWDVSGLDLPLALAMGGPTGFPLRDHWLLTTVLHSGAKWLAWLLVLALCIGATVPFGPLRRLPLARRVQLVATTLLASGFVALMKASSHVSCPWDLQQFGGIARYMSHWAGWTAFDGGGGRCFPAGHASTGFAFVGGYFALRKELPGMARWWLAGALSVGFVLGISQQLRGAHFMSHTLWTGWICWALVWLADPLFARHDTKPVLDLQPGVAPS